MQEKILRTESYMSLNHTMIENPELKNREFGKDITNAFIVARKSLDQVNNNKMSFGNNNTKNMKTGDLKNFQNLNQKKDLKKTQTLNCINTTRFGAAPKQSFGINIKKPIKKTSCFLPNNMIIETENSKNIKSDMEIDNSSTNIKYFNENENELEIKISSNSNDELQVCNKENEELICHTENNCNISNININEVNNNLFKNGEDSNKFEYHPEFTDPGHQFNNNPLGNENENMYLHNKNNFNHCNSGNIQEIPEYSHSIFLHLKETEIIHSEYYPTANYMKNQYDINDKMRAILYDWLVDVHLKFKLLPETLFITFNLIDRYLNKKNIPRTKLQLVGVSSMLIACKYEEIYAPEVKDFVYITDKAYTAEEVRAMELDILVTLEFNITFPTSLRFSEFFHHFIKYSKVVFNFAMFLLELSIVDYKMLKYKSSLIASAVIYVSTKLLHKENISFNECIEIDLEKLYDLSGYSEEEIKDCAKDVCLIYDNSEKTGLFAIRKKYSLPKFDEVSKIKFGK